MLTEICAALHNYFCDDLDKHHGKFIISGGDITPPDFLSDGQYFRIVGSKFNDGVYKYPAADLTDETFSGSVWAMSVPPALVKLSEQIKQYEADNRPSAFASESFGGYAYTKATDSNGAVADWHTVFSARLNQWRKMQ